MDSNPFWPWEPGPITIELLNYATFPARIERARVEFKNFPNMSILVEFDRDDLFYTYSRDSVQQLLEERIAEAWRNRPTPYIPSNIVLSDN